MNGKLRNMTSIYLRKGDSFLLLHRQGGRVANNLYTGAAGGHFEPHELNDALSCILREMKEELGITPDCLKHFSLRYVTLRYMESEIRQNYYFFAEIGENFPRDIRSNEGRLQWFDAEALPHLDMPLSAKPVLLHYVNQGQYDDHLYGGVYRPDGVAFTPMT